MNQGAHSGRNPVRVLVAEALGGSGPFVGRGGPDMRLAVVQMLPVGERDGDAARLHALVSQARELGAEVVVVPAVPSLEESASIEGILAEGGQEPVVLGPPAGEGLAAPAIRESPLGRLVDLAGDQAIDPALHPVLRQTAPDALVMRPAAESPLQAEAVLELAVGYSTAIAGLVLIPATAGLDALGDAFGGSAIIQHGEVLAEAVEADEVLVADVDPPVRLQEPVAPLPEPQLILRQRLAHHRGSKASVEWLADLD